MPFSLIEHPFSAASKSGKASFQIVERRDEHKIPVALLQQDEAMSTDEARMLAENIKDSFNTLPLLHRFGQAARTLHFERIASGVLFRFHAHDGEGRSLGTSVLAASLTVGDAYRDFFERWVADKGLERVLEAGSERERRQGPRMHGEPHAGQAATAPAKPRL